VLPRGLHKVWHYGFLSRRSKIDLDRLRAAFLVRVGIPASRESASGVRRAPFSLANR